MIKIMKNDCAVPLVRAPGVAIYAGLFATFNKLSIYRQSRTISNIKKYAPFAFSIGLIFLIP